MLQAIIYILYHKLLKGNIIYIPQACCTSHPFLLHKVSSPYKLKSMHKTILKTVEQIKLCLRGMVPKSSRRGATQVLKSISWMFGHS